MEVERAGLIFCVSGSFSRRFWWEMMEWNVNIKDVKPDDWLIRAHLHTCDDKKAHSHLTKLTLAQVVIVLTSTPLLRQSVGPCVCFRRSNASVQVQSTDRYRMCLASWSGRAEAVSHCQTRRKVFSDNPKHIVQTVDIRSIGWIWWTLRGQDKSLLHVFCHCGWANASYLQWVNTS